MAPDDYDYELPQALIAQHPAAQRGDAKMMVLRDDECVLAPDDDFVLGPEDELLLSGLAGARRALGMTLVIDATREYVVTGRYVPASWAWRRLTGYRPEAH